MVFHISLQKSATSRGAETAAPPPLPRARLPRRVGRRPGSRARRCPAKAREPLGAAARTSGEQCRGWRDFSGHLAMAMAIDLYI